MGVRIQGTIRKDDQEYNGLEAIAEQLEKPGKRVFVVAEVEAVGYEVDFKKGGIRSQKIRFVSIEPLNGDDVIAARKLRDEAYSARTGQAAPPPSLFDDDPDDDDERVYTRAGIHREQPDVEAPDDEAPAADPAPAAMFSDGAADGPDGPDSEGPWPDDVDAEDGPDTADTAG